jgi:hypothetical protein
LNREADALVDPLNGWPVGQNEIQLVDLLTG